MNPELKYRDFSDSSARIAAHLDSASTLGVEVARWEISEEKEAFLVQGEYLVETLPFKPGECIIVAGIGMAGESRRFGEKKRVRYPSGDGPALLSFDNNIFVMQSADKTTLEDVRKGLSLLDIADLYTEVKPGTCRFFSASSILHHFKSEGGWDGLVHNFKQMVRATLTDGIIFVRDFSPPEFLPCEVEFKTDLAKRFFDAFTISFLPRVMPGFAKEPLIRTVNGIKTNNLYAFDLITHFRMFYNDCYHTEWGGNKMFYPNYWKQWAETEGAESYVLTRQKYPSIEEVCNALVDAASASGKLTYDLQLKDDSSDDTMLKGHFRCTPDILFPSKRAWIRFTKTREEKE